MKNKLIERQLKNAEGKRLLEKTRLEYSNEIISLLKKNPVDLYPLLDTLELTIDDFMKYLSGELKGNIVLYDQTLSYLNRTNKRVRTITKNK